jgi:phenylacetate-CoA ligase
MRGWEYFPVRELIACFRGSHEFIGIAFECPRNGGYHISDQTLIVEVLRDGHAVGPGEEGELVGTALHSYAMPFIRYRFGDLVILGPSQCPCGAPFSTLSRIQGRTLERIRLPDGRTIHPYAVIGPLVQSVPWIRRFQIIQDQRDHFRIKLVPKFRLEQRELAKIGAVVLEKLGQGARVDVEVIEQKPRQPVQGEGCLNDHHMDFPGAVHAAHEDLLDVRRAARAGDQHHGTGQLSGIRHNRQ